MTLRRWRVDVYYSSFATSEVLAKNSEDALEQGRLDVDRRLRQGVVIDPDGALGSLVQDLEPWPACDAVEELPDATT
jgi:hypothetical protein